MKKALHSVAFEAEIKSLLAAHGPLRTKDILPAIKAKFPESCNDSELDNSNGEIAWKHRVRGAQASLKKKNEIAHSKASRCWSLV